ncbi:MAG TPA: AgmX/PglI C-terminal domain-containing protein, partial [Kofleriaceae bacterium]|nr:AgmX/PglI C-terminal domain-containing protein [Kofleriaceae bacterium]
MLMKSKDKPAAVASADKTATTETAKPADTGSAAAAPTTATDNAAKPADTGSAAAAGSATQVAEADTHADTHPAESHTTAPKAETHTAPKAETHTSHAATTPRTETHSAPAHNETHAAAPPADTGGGGCDEVSCVLNNYDGACCAKFKKKGGGGGGAAPSGGGGHSDLPDALDRSMISAGIANVKARVSACGDRSSAKGKVKVHVKVGGDGRVSSVNVETSPDASLGACVAAAVQRASFAKTQSGGSFSYPFVF